jgi:hypothetical protein
MGSHEFQRLPKTPPFRRVVGLIGIGAGFTGTTGVLPGSIDSIADATLEASLYGLERAKTDEGLSYAFYLLTQLTQAARQPDFLAVLNGLGLPAPKASHVPTLPDASDEEYDIADLIASFTAKIDRHLSQTRSRTDIGELAQQAAAESLAVLCNPISNTLFGSSLETIKDSLRALSTKKGFANLTQDFYARLAKKYLLYHLSRELSNHVGQGRRFVSVNDHNDFLRELDMHCHVSSQMLRKFAGDWYSKANWEGGVTLRKAKGFTIHAIEKMRFALQQKGAVDEE